MFFHEPTFFLYFKYHPPSLGHWKIFLLQIYHLGGITKGRLDFFFFFAFGVMLFALVTRKSGALGDCGLINIYTLMLNIDRIIGGYLAHKMKAHNTGQRVPQ